jgi:hypothetical protein
MAVRAAHAAPRLYGPVTSAAAAVGQRFRANEAVLVNMGDIEREVGPVLHDDWYAIARVVENAHPCAMAVMPVERQLLVDGRIEDGHQVEAAMTMRQDRVRLV